MPLPEIIMKRYSEHGAPTRMLEDLIFDLNTRIYKSASQEREISELRKKLEEKKEDARRNLENIIGFYYKR